MKLEYALNSNKTFEIESNTKLTRTDFFILFSICAYFFIDFVPQLGSIDIIGPQYVFLCLLNLGIGIYFYINKQYYNHNIYPILFKNTTIRLYILFIILTGVSFFSAFNISESVINYARIIIVFITFLNFLLLLHARLHLLNKLAFIIGLSLFLQSFLAFKEIIIKKETLDIAQILLKTKGNTGNINILSASFCIKLPFVFFGIVFSKGWKKIMYLITFTLAVIIILLLSSRATYLSILIQTLFFIVLIIKVCHEEKRKLYSLFYIIIALMISYLSANSILKSSYEKNRFNSIENRINQIKITDNSVALRLVFWKNAITIIKQNPIFGIGIGNWKIESIPLEKISNHDSHFSLHTHNDFLEITAETGILNGFIFLATFISIAVHNIRTFFRNNRFETKIISIIILLSLISYGIDAFFNFPMYRPTMQVSFMLFMALSVLNTFIKQDNNKKESLISFESIQSTQLVISVLVLYIALVNFKAFRIERKIASDFNKSKYTLTSVEVTKELPLFPNLSVHAVPYRQQIARYCMEERNIDLALKNLEAAIEINPYLPSSYYYKSQIYNNKHQIDSAFYYSKKAFHAGPADETYFNFALNIAALKGDTIEILKIHDKYTKYAPNASNWLKTSNALEKTNYNINNNILFLDSGIKRFPKDTRLINKKLELKKNKKINPMKN